MNINNGSMFFFTNLFWHIRRPAVSYLALLFFRFHWLKSSAILCVSKVGEADTSNVVFGIEPIKRVYAYNGCMYIVFKDTPFTLGSLTDIPRIV